MTPLSAAERPLPLSDDHEVGWHMHPITGVTGTRPKRPPTHYVERLMPGVGQVVALIHSASERHLKAEPVVP
jgi:hypothetical protein